MGELNGKDTHSFLKITKEEIESGEDEDDNDDYRFEHLD